MVKKKGDLSTFLCELMSRRKQLPSQMASDLGVSHSTVSRWLSGKDVPGVQSCQRLADISGMPVEKVLCSAGHLPSLTRKAPADWPEFREYARRKYPNELDEDLVIMIEDLIERRRQKRHNHTGTKLGI